MEHQQVFWQTTETVGNEIKKEKVRTESEFNKKFYWKWMQNFQLNNLFNINRIKLRFLHEKSFKSWRVLQRVQNKNRKTQRLNGKNC